MTNTHYIEKTLPVDGANATIAVIKNYTHFKDTGMFNVQVNLFQDLTWFNSNPLNPLNPNGLITSFNCAIADVDTTNGDEVGLLNYIVANESDFVGGVVKAFV